MIRRAAAAALACLLFALSLCACANPKEFSDDEKISAKYSRDKSAYAVTYNFSDGAEDPPASYNNFSLSAGELSLKLFASRAAEKTSFTISPVSAVLQLSMLSNAAGKDRRADIISALGGAATVDALNACSSYFKSRMETVSKKGPEKGDWQQVKLSGAMLTEESVEVKSSFLQRVRDYYGYDVFRYDFNGEHAAEKLDDYLEDFTDGSGISLPKGSSLNTVSASEIKDSWLVPYAEADITKGSFNGDGGAREVEFLRSAESGVKSDKAVGIVKYAAKNPLKLVLVTSKDEKAFDEYLKSFDYSELKDLLGSIDITQKTTAVIPEFTVESDGKANALSAALGKCGFAELFRDKSGFPALSYTTQAALGEMYEIPPRFSLTRSGVNAEKDETAEMSAAVKTKDTVTFDRPFIFMLVDNETDIPVTMGVYR